MANETVVLAEDVAGKMLASAGIPVVAGQPVASVDMFRDGAAGVTFPVVLKACGQGLLHKTELGAVEVGIRDRAGLEAAARRMIERLPFRPERFLVQAMAGDGLEVIVGAHRDPVFGPVIVVGMGGILAELHQDTAIGTAPMDLDKAMDLLRSLRGWPLFDGYRGQGRLDAGAVAACMVRLAGLVGDDADIVSVDINPLRVYADGCLALDTAMVVRAGAGVRELPEEAGTRARGERDLSPVSSRDAGGDVRHGDSSSGAVPGRSGARGREREESSGGRWSARRGIDLLRGGGEADLGTLFDPRGIAVVGVARTPGKAGRVIFENLKRAGYSGRLYPVNPAIDMLLGHRCYPRVSDIGDRVDLAVLAVPRTQVPLALDDAAAAGVRSVIVTSGGFSDAGEEGRQAEQALRNQASRLGIRVLGPNSIGIIDPARGINTSITTLEPLDANRLAFVGQTGLFAAGFAAMLRDEPPYGVGRVVCLGNRAGVDEAHVLDDLAGDARIDAVGLYVEGVKDGARFRESAARLLSSKPLVVLKGGQSRVGAAAVASHTGSLAGSREVFAAVLRELGAVTAEGFSELFDVMQALACGGRPRGRKLGVVSVSGAGCVLAADGAERVGLELPGLTEGTLAKVREIVPEWAPARNPLDVWSGIERWGPAQAYLRCGEALLSQPDIDALLLAFVMIPEADFDVGEVLSPLRRRFPGKPIYAVLFGGTAESAGRWKRSCFAAGIPVYTDIQAAMNVFGKLCGTSRGA